jgi:uncharacterized protein (UPF0261 family)
MKTVALLGAFDTKGAEYGFVKDIIEQRGHKTFLIDVGVLGEPKLDSDVSREQTAKAGGVDIGELISKKDRGEAVAAMSRGAAKLLKDSYDNGRFDGVISLGGTGGTSVACNAMRGLPLGVAKVMVSTVAGGDVSSYVGQSDIVMVPSIVDVAGINSVSRGVFARAAGLICGMVETEVPRGQEKPVVAATMFGNTTPAVEKAMEILEIEGYDVLVFHCTGNGGKTMESLINARMVKGVLDITTTEWADELVGGVFTAGSERLEGAAKTGVPSIVVPGCLDMVNFWEPDSVPSKFSGRKFYQHNPNVTLMRTNIEENSRLGEIMAEKLNMSKAPVTVLIPLQGWSMIDADGGDFWWPEADEAFVKSLKKNLREDVPVIELDCNINDPEFAQRCAETLIAEMKEYNGC